MKKLFLASLILMVVLGSRSVGAEIIWQEDFDGYIADWSLSNDNDGRPNCPDGFVECAGDHSTSDAPDIEIHTDYERSNPGGSNRGYRVWIYSGTSGTCCENVLRAVANAGYDFYLRWYMRLSTKNIGNYWKMFRFWDTGGNHRFILEPKYRAIWGETRFIITTTAGDESAWTSWVISDDYAPNTWVCMEVHVNQTNDQVTLWVNGDNKGTIGLPWSTNWNVGRIGVGGNQTAAPGGAHFMDYDDIVVSTTYVGPDENEQPNTPTNFRFVQ